MNEFERKAEAWFKPIGKKMDDLEKKIFHDYGDDLDSIENYPDAARG